MLLALAVLAVPALPAPQATWYVDAQGSSPGTGTSGDPYTRIDYALAQPGLQSGDTVLVKPGEYVDEAIDFRGLDVHLLAESGAAVTTIRGLGPQDPTPHPLVRFTGNESAAAILEGFTITQGSGGDVPFPLGGQGGGGVLIDGASPTLRACHFVNNSGTNLAGGGLYVHGNPMQNPVRIEDCTFESNNAGTGQGGAFALYYAAAEFHGCTFQNNGSGLAGATFGFESEVLLQECDFTGNTSGGDGGAGVFEGGTMTIDGCDVRDGFATFCGAGFALTNLNATITGSHFETNSSTCGGALAIWSTQTNIATTMFIGNVSAESEAGGAIMQVGGQLTATDCEFINNRAGSGGAIHASSFSGSSGQNDFAHMTECRFAGNRAASFKNFQQPKGGAIFASLPLSLTTCEFETNIVEFQPVGSSPETAEGGALHSSNATTIHDCRFAGNRASASESALGGALHLSGPTTMTRSLLTDNSATGAGVTGGSAVFGPADLDFCTLRDNICEQTGAAVEAGQVRNCILWDNLPAQLHSSVSASYSIVQGGAPGLGVLSGDPLFWGPADSHVLPGSPAINQGDPSSPFDPNGTVADIGVFPFDPFHCGPGCDGIVGTQYCDSAPNSLGLTAQLTVLGANSVTDDFLILHAFDMPIGMPSFFLGANGTDFVPGFGGSQGVLCLGPPAILRFNMPIQNTRGGGEVTQLVHPSNFPNGFVVQAGETWYFQGWYRDAMGGVLTSNTTNAWAVQY